MGISRFEWFLRSFASAALIAMLVSQVENHDLSSKSLIWAKAFRRQFCTDLFDMAFAKLSEGISSSSLGGCYQLLLAPAPDATKGLTISHAGVRPVVVGSSKFFTGSAKVEQLFPANAPS